jgi:hypothetical protein
VTFSCLSPFSLLAAYPRFQEDFNTLKYVLFGCYTNKL